MENNITDNLQYAGRSLPKDIDAEIYLLGGVIQDSEKFSDLVQLVDTDSFALEKHRFIWKALLSIYERGNEIDFVTLSDELSRSKRLESVGGKEYLMQLAGAVPSAANAEYHAEIVREKSILRKLIENANLTIKEAMEPSAESVDVLQNAEKNIFALAEKQTRDSLHQVKPLLESVLQKITERKKDISGLNTGFASLNKITGGLQKSDLIVLAARPGVGKTSFALSLAVNAAVDNDYKVAFFSLEMGGEQLVQRILSIKSQVGLQNLRTGYLTGSDMSNIQMVSGPIAESHFFIDDNSDLGISELMSKTRKLKSLEGGLDLVIVDYLQLMRTGKEENRSVAIGAISRGLKILAKDLQIPIIALAQLNRKVEEKGREEPKLSDLRESGSIEQDADMVWFVEREFNKDESMPIDKGTLIIAKHRNGSTGNIPLAFIKKTTYFMEREETEEEQNSYSDDGFIDDGGF